MKTGDLIKIIKNDMSLVIKIPGPKNNNFFDQVGTIINQTAYKYRLYRWFIIQLPSGIYEAREDAIKVIND